jgi:hypothetical protein
MPDLQHPDSTSARLTRQLQHRAEPKVLAIRMRLTNPTYHFAAEFAEVGG